MLKEIGLSVLLLFVYNNLFCQEQDKFSSETGKNTIRAADIKELLRVLTSDELAGRETGKEGQKLAAEFLAGKMKEYGIKPGNDTSYFQHFQVEELKPEGTLSVNAQSYNFLNEFYFMPGTNDTIIESAGIVFCGFGIDDPAYSDYAKVNVKDKVILILEGEPKSGDTTYLLTGNNKPSKWAHDVRKKSATAKKYGALGVIYYSAGYEKTKELLHHFIEKPTMRLKDDKTISKGKERTNFIFVGDNVLNNLLSKSKTAKKEIDRILRTEKAPKKYPVIKTEFKLSIKRTFSEVTSENVIGFIEGTDKKDEIIIITAHYDHLGKQGNEIYYGADDDGSGTSAILEIGKAIMKMVENGQRPRRSIIIMPVAGEEKGLLGSKYYTLFPTVSLDNIVADLNIDMIGRRDEKYADDPNYVYVIGSDMLSPDLKKVSENSNEKCCGLKLDYMYDDPNDPNRFYYRSDHYNFAKNNIPVIFYFCGVHADYHKPTDTFDKIEFDKMEKIAQLVFETAWELANREERLKLKEE